jgi:signal peptidase II
VTRAGAWLRAGAVVATVVAVDQITKAVVRSSLRVGERDDLVLGIKLVRTRNEGIAFGALGGAGTVVVVAVGLALVGLLVFFALHSTRRFAWLPTGLLLGGALGNIVDRVVDGSVTDFIKLPHWPAFNVADIAITFGVLSLVLVLDAHRGR